MLVYGGSALDSGGFREPDLYVLTRGEGSDDNPGSETASVGSDAYATLSPSQQPPHRRASASVASRRSSVASLPPLDDEFDQATGRPQKTIWQRLNTNPDGSLNGKEPAEKWDELKLAMSFPGAQLCFSRVCWFVW